MFCYIAEQSLLLEILEVLLKDCWGPHKGLFGSCMQLSEQWLRTTDKN